jgi:hypothetical protein
VLNQFQCFRISLPVYFSSLILTVWYHRFEGQISGKNIEIGIIDEKRIFKYVPLLPILRVSLLSSLVKMHDFSHLTLHARHEPHLSDRGGIDFGAERLKYLRCSVQSFDTSRSR